MGKLKSVEHKIKAAFFAISSPFLKRGDKEFQPLDASKLRRVLFLRPEKIGDMVISFPVFDGLRKQYPHIKISILGSPRNETIIKNDPRFEKVFLYIKRPLEILSMIRAVRKEKYDCVVDMICDDSVTALILSQFCAPGKPRIGVGKIKFRSYYDFNYDHRMNNSGHIIDNTLKLLEAFGIDSSKVNGYAQPYLDEQSDQQAEKFISSINKNNENLLVGYNLSAGSPTRVWALKKSCDLLERILNYSNSTQIVLFTIPPERDRAEKVKAFFESRVVLVPDNLSLIGASAVIKRLDVMITPDTSLVHIARAFGVQVVGLYSRFMKNFLLWKPFDQEVGAVVSNNDDNIFDIKASAVYDAFVEVCKTIEKHKEVS